MSIGSSAVSSGVNGISIGNSSSNNGEDSISIGHNAVVTGIQAIAIGAESSTNSTVGGRATVVGYSARATSGSSAFGYNSTAEASSSVAIGETAHSEGGDAIAIGHSSHARNGWSIAIGSNAVAYESNTIAIGRDANASKDGNIAIGTNACQGVTGTNVTCLGSNSGPASKYSHLSGDSNMVYIGDPNSTVFIPGNLAVRGTVLLNGERGRVVLRPGNAQGDWAVIRKDDYDGRDDNLRGYPTDVGEDKAWYDRYSDRRLKYVGKENTSGLEKIKQLKVFNYTFKKDDKKTPHVGVIAQDLQKVFPDAVTKAKDGFLRIRFEDMFYAMINAIKELDSRITALEKENQELTEILKQVQNDNRKLQDDNKEFETRLKILEAKIK